MNDRGTQHGSRRNTPPPALTASCTFARLSIAISPWLKSGQLAQRPPRSSMFHPDSEGIENIVMVCKKSMPVADRDSRQASVSWNLVLARIQGGAGRRVQHP